MKRVLSEKDIKEAARKGQKTIQISKSIMVTSAARDTAKSLGITIEQISDSKPDVTESKTEKVKYKGKIAIGSDHGGFQLKEKLKTHLEELGYTVFDVGTSSEDPCDYPDYAFAVAKLVSTGEVNKGIMIDAVGVASAIVANKLSGIRAAACQTEFAARSSREHNDANVLTLGGRILGLDLAKNIVNIFLNTEYAGGRHQKRVDKINDIDIKYRKS
ncbi:MAG: Ribose 5-phosphate isomerase B [Ignavibacteriae bacterium]|nr:MAG: Ribose 5-phosphate isomerase B [Ignavibacteriota bacterium]